MMEPYRPECFEELKAFARRQPNFGYVREIIKMHLVHHHPGGCWVWREQGRLAAFCGMLYTNPDDAWLYGMRVDDRFKSKGIATRFTRQLFRVAAGTGRTWVGLNTLEHRRPAPVFRIAEKLGMKLEAVHATDPFWGLPKRFKRPGSLRRTRNIARLFLNLGEKTIFREGQGWVWLRMLPARRRWVNRHGFLVQGTPVHIVDHGIKTGPSGDYHLVTVNLYDRPKDFGLLLGTLFGYAAGKGHGLTINYPAEWRYALRRAAYRLVPGLKAGKNRWFSVWRIYGKRLHPRA